MGLAAENAFRPLIPYSANDSSTVTQDAARYSTSSNSLNVHFVEFLTSVNRLISSDLLEEALFHMFTTFKVWHTKREKAKIKA